MLKSLTIETETAVYALFFWHIDFVTYVNQTFLGKPLGISTCVPAITEAKPPHRIFLNLECIINPFKTNTYWENLSNEAKDNMIIDFLITNINHESLHKAIFEAPEISSLLEKHSFLLSEYYYNLIEYIVAEMELELV
jgi:hypothetical protein